MGDGNKRLTEQEINDRVEEFRRNKRYLGHEERLYWWRDPPPPLSKEERIRSQMEKWKRNPKK